MVTLSTHMAGVFACKDAPSLSFPNIISCLMTSLRKAYSELVEIARREDEQNVAFNILRDLAAIKAKDDNGGALNAVEAAIRRMNGGKAGGDVNEKGEVGCVNSLEGLVRETAKYTELCVLEAEKHGIEVVDDEEVGEFVGAGEEEEQKAACKLER